MTEDWKAALGALLDEPSLSSGEEADKSSVSPETEADSKTGRRTVLTLHYEKKGRAGKPATIIAGFPEDDDTEALSTARELKQRIGCGGSARGGEILLQGDRRDIARRLLTGMGYKVKN